MVKLLLRQIFHLKTELTLCLVDIIATVNYELLERFQNFKPTFLAVLELATVPFLFGRNLTGKFHYIVKEQQLIKFTNSAYFPIFVENEFDLV